MTRKAPYRHADGSNCWTKNCSKNRISPVTNERLIIKPVEPVTELPPFSAFQKAHADGRLESSSHRELPYVTYKYSRVTQFGYDWDDVTMSARGIIFNAETGEVVARPFAKFFNYNEPTVPVDSMHGRIAVTDKMDGCFTSEARLNLWDGGTITIGEVVKNKLLPTLVGMDDGGNLVPTVPVNWFDNGKKKTWLNIFLDSPTDCKSGAGGHRNRMEVTPNHHLFVNGKYIPAGDVKPGDVMSGQVREIDEAGLHFIKASLLGDGSVSATQNGAKYEESHSEKQEEYVMYMRSLLSEISANRSDTVSGYGSRLVWVGSRLYSNLLPVREEWYPKGKKVIPEDLSWMDDFAVAKWYMDDGSLSHNSQQFQNDRALFSTNGFTQEDVNRLAERLTEMYGVSCTVFFSKGWNLRVNSGKGNSITKMWESIAPHIHPSLRYKLPVSFRNVIFTPYSLVTETRAVKHVTVTNVEEVPVKEKAVGRTAYDIGTETENYMVNGVIVHNSLGIGYQTPDGEFLIATAGSFHSEQAQHATELYKERYDGKWEPNPELTYMWEIIYPENRVVIDYGDEDDIYLIGAMNKKTGVSVPVSDVTEWKWKRAEEYKDMSSLENVLASPDRDNREGFIVHYLDTDVRVKYKHEEYLKIHRVATGVTAKTIWRKMRNGENVDEWRQSLPEEFIDFIGERQNDIQSNFNKEIVKITEDHKKFKASMPAGYSRKDFATTLFASDLVDHENKPYILNMEFNKRPYNSHVQANKIWDRIKPDDETQFWNM